MGRALKSDIKQLFILCNQLRGMPARSLGIAAARKADYFANLFVADELAHAGCGNSAVFRL